ncbi:hypothetical protein L1049_010055 [Liquidambar formosana]|uniref:Bromodomain associated domain-containing protein n=1 Tax=Liquidambar formosana TaxID=63359 RepID=A0AAP0NAD0_LIQFO
MDPKSKTLKTFETPPASPSHFSFTITKVAVSQICQSIGFKGSKTSALETLTNIAAIYLQTLAKSASAYATSSGRTDSNLFDLIYALEDLASVHGYPGASNVNNPLLRSATVIDIMNFVESTDEIPFAKPIPHDNTQKESIPPKNCNEFGRAFEQRSHIPRWLPPFPDPSTYEICSKTRFHKSIRRENSLKIFGSLRNSDTFAQDIEQNDSIGGRASCEEEERGSCGMELAAERARVRFKMCVGGEEIVMGVDLRNGVCRGGKRVSWDNNYSRMGEQEGEVKRRRL